MKFIKRLFFLILVLGGLLATALALVDHYYQNEVKAYVKSQINEQLQAPVDVEEITFSLTKKFPNASVVFNQVLAWDAFPGRESNDTLLFADKIYFEFSLVDLLFGKYQIKQISLDRVDLHLRWDAKGVPNYVIWKENETQENPVLIEIDEVAFSRTRLTIDQARSQWRSWYVIRNLSLKKTDLESNDRFKISTEIGAFASHSNAFSYTSKGAIKLKSNLFIQPTHVWKLESGKLDYSEVEGYFSGQMNFNANTYEFIISASEQAVNPIREKLPVFISDQLNGYSIEGATAVNVVTGNQRRKNWETLIDLDLKKGQITHNASNTIIKDVAFKGSLDLKSTRNDVFIDHFEGAYAGGVFKGEASIVNLNQPHLDLKLNGTLSLPELLDFFEAKGLENAYGQALIDINYSGPIGADSVLTPREILQANIVGFIETQDLGFDVPKQAMQFDHLNGKIRMMNNLAVIDRVSGVWKGSNSRIEGTVENLIPFMLSDNEKLIIRGDARFDYIQLENFLSDDSTDQKSLEIPCFLDLNVNAIIDRFTYQNFEAQAIKGQIMAKDCELKSDRLHFNTSGGSVYASVNLKTSAKGHLLFSTKSLVSQLNIDNLFYAFNNFGQNVILYDQIKGKISADVTFEGAWDERLHYLPDNLKASAIVKVENGELIGVKSLQQIGEYLRKNALTNVLIDTKTLNEKLKHVYFDQLTNRIEIDQQKVIIPNMNLTSSILDLNLSGSHAFDNTIDYKMNFRWRELINQRKETEFGTIEDDGTGMRLFMSMKGTASNPKFEMDKAAKKAWRESQWKNEGKSITKALGNELQNLFSGSPSVLSDSLNRKKVEIEWEHREDSAKTSQETDTLKTNAKKVIFESEEDIRDSDEDDY